MATKQTNCGLCGVDIVVSSRCAIHTRSFFCESCKLIRRKDCEKRQLQKRKTRVGGHYKIPCSCGNLKDRKSTMCQSCHEKVHHPHVADWIEKAQCDEHQTVTITDQQIRKNTKIRPFILTRQANKCAICGIPPNWNNKPMVFVMDHIDGNHQNNAPHNMRLICRNCDGQLDNFGGRNRGHGREYEREYQRKRARSHRLVEQCSGLPTL